MVWGTVHRIASDLGGFGFAEKALVATVPVFGVLGGVLGSWLTASRNVYINSITSERSKWIEKLRQNFADYNSTMLEIYGRITVSDAGTSQSDHIDLIVKLTRTGILIRLQLNPHGEIDANIIRMISAIEVFTEEALVEVNELEPLLLLHAQYLLKAEWEKVKWEAGGVLYRGLHCLDSSRRVRRYREFVRGAGKFEGATAKLEKIAGKYDDTRRAEVQHHIDKS